jgi:hypothetical protein
MAKTTKKRGGRPPGRPLQGSATVPKAAPATPGGPNRQARKEEARRQREALQRKSTRRRVYRVVAIVTAVLVVALGLSLFVITRPTTAKQAGCGSIQTIAAFPGGHDRDHIGGGQTAQQTMPPLKDYPSTPPASGPHNPTPLDAGVYTQPPAIDQAIHSLEHGAVEIWYAPEATTSQALADIKRFYGQPATQDHIIVAPYNYLPQVRGSLPADKQMALVAWHVLQTCARPSLAVVQDFVRKYRAPTGFNAQNPGSYVGTAPEAGSAI